MLFTNSIFPSIAGLWVVYGVVCFQSTHTWHDPYLLLIVYATHIQPVRITATITPIKCSLIIWVAVIWVSFFAKILTRIELYMGGVMSVVCVLGFIWVYMGSVVSILWVLWFRVYYYPYRAVYMGSVTSILVYVWIDVMNNYLNTAIQTKLLTVSRPCSGAV